MKINTKYVNQNKREETNAHKQFTNRNAPLTFIRQRQRSTIVATFILALNRKRENVSLMAKLCSHPAHDVVINQTRR